MDSNTGYKFLKIISLSFFISILGFEWIQGQTINFSIQDSVLTTIGEDFYGIQYHSNSYNSSVLLNKLDEIPIKKVRIWAWPNEIRPNLNEWNWSDLDTKINEVVEAGYDPILCIFQAEDWYTGSPNDPWWNDPAAINEWMNVVEKITLRYSEQIEHIILFDELNYLKQENPYYISFSKSADLFIETASAIKDIDPSIKVGGPSGFNGWENGHWANYVLNQTQHDTLLDFISSNIFLSWDKDESDKAIIDKTIWYEEAPRKITEMIDPLHAPSLILDAYNASALWTIDGTKDGELWTDPRNVNTFGGVYQALAQLHSAKGGFDMILKWETIGGYGLFDWFPSFNELPTYYSWKLITQKAELEPGSSLMNITTSETPVSDLPHHSGMNVKGYQIQPFATKSVDEEIKIILINKYDTSREASISTPDKMNSYSLYKFHNSRIENSLVPVDSGSAHADLNITLPPLSINIISYSKTDVPTSISDPGSEISPDNFTLLQNYPNPFNPTTVIGFQLGKASYVELDIYNSLGQKIQEHLGVKLSAGRHSFTFDGSDLPSGIYFYQLTVDDRTELMKFTLIK